MLLYLGVGELGCACVGVEEGDKVFVVDEAGFGVVYCG